MNTKTRLLVALCATLAMVGVATAEVALTGAGATFPYPMYSKWFDEYHKLHPDIQINYQSIGSGGGIRQVTEGTVDFGATDGPMNDEQLKEFKDKRGSDILHFPTVLGADVPTYNIPGVTAELKFTPEALAGIYLGKITKWNDPGIAKANPDVKLPDNDIVVVHRSDGSGTTYIWVDYLPRSARNGKRRSAWAPRSTGRSGSAARATKALPGRSSRRPTRIGYVELIYALQNKMPYGPVKNSAGELRQGGPGERDRRRGRRGARTCRTTSASPSPTLPARTPTRSPASPGC